MGFIENLPKWLAVGTEPPESLKSAGYKVKDAPAPNHFNFMFNRTYKALLELQVNAVHKDDYKMVSDSVTNLTARLNNPDSSALTLTAGTQTITAARDMPFNLSAIPGRMLLNLLGRAGTFDTTSGWIATNSNITVNQNSALYGNTCLKIIMDSSPARVYRSINTVVGSRYIVAAEVCMLSATGAYVVAGKGSGNIVTSTDYAISYYAFVATDTATEIGISVTGAHTYRALADGLRVYEISASDYSAIGSMSPADVALRYPYTEGLAGVRNPYAIRWTSAAKTDVAAMLAFDTELLAAPVPASDAERDRLEQGVDGQYYKTSAWYKYVITGDTLNYIRIDNATGYKSIRSRLPAPPIKDSGYVIKFNGAILARVAQGASPSSGDQQIVLDSTDGVPNSLLLTVSTSDSGWGDSYTPTADEVRSFFAGWKMYDYNNGNGMSTYNAQSGQVKGWCRRFPGANPSYSSSYTEGTQTLPATQAAGWTPYELMYKRAVTVTEPIASEGALSLVQGDNTIEAGSGLVMREAVKPFYDGMWNINNGNASYEVSLTRFRPGQFINIYKNGYVDKWAYGTSTVGVGALAQQSPANYDTAAVYTASYIRLDKFPVTAIVGSTPANERAMLDDLVRDMQQTTRRVSVVENKKTDRDMVDWIYPTLLNGVTTYDASVNMPPAYRKSGNVVYLGGVIANAVSDTIIFRLPAGYRPTKNRSISTMADNLRVARLFVNPAGDVYVSFASPLLWLSLDGLSFTI